MKKQKNGFISMSLIYSFFIVFVIILLALLGIYTNNRVLLDRVKKEIKNELADLENYSLLCDNSSNEDTLRCKIIAQETDAATIEAKGNPDMSVVPTALTSGLYATEDEYGISFYYRGEKNSLANNVIFGEFQWKIVRINGDGTIRLIYNGTCPANTCTINSTGIATNINNGTTYAWNLTNSNDAKYVGYMYGGVNGVASISKEQAQTNTTNSNVKVILDNWYMTNFKNTIYEQYIIDNIFCNDRSIESGLGYGTNVTYYKNYLRIFTNQSNPTPSLKCEQQNDRFTVNNITRGNGALTYPIGLITVDEIQFSGIGYGIYNNNQYLYTGQNYWSFSPSFNGSIDAYNWHFHSASHPDNFIVKNAFGLRSVINLDSKVLVSEGDGSINNPYKIFIE